MSKIRQPYNAGSWYAGGAASLKKQIENECFLHRLGPGKVPELSRAGSRNVVGLLCPHAGYMYSGPIAAHSYFALAADGPPETVVILGPNHTGMGSAVSLMVEGVWRTPLGDVPVNSSAAKAIQKRSAYLDIDDKAHLYEHSIELQLPFLQYFLGSNFDMVPICMMLQDLEVALDVGKAVAEALKETNALVIASSDMTHYEPQSSAERKDKVAIEALKKLNEEELFQTVHRLGISMCGVGPTAAMLCAAKLLGAKKGVLLKYATSGDVTGDLSAVVGYCSLAALKT
ncbi:AmmeMemoRadiSam system protein B [Candidatus Hecatella orcuttiae]|uniref:AmmeMemoRadiSam system protein B n=1 Tax=Candidatus Hecatella orcuttiae TaxID=1935119 RepID=UPI002868287D|nr:AmmeMemoRadiSam system protein B [Candidatus Hecatella orcuttiae]